MDDAHGQTKWISLYFQLFINYFEFYINNNIQIKIYKIHKINKKRYKH